MPDVIKANHDIDYRRRLGNFIGDALYKYSSILLPMSCQSLAKMIFSALFQAEMISSMLAANTLSFLKYVYGLKYAYRHKMVN